MVINRVVVRVRKLAAMRLTKKIIPARKPAKRKGVGELLTLKRNVPMLRKIRDHVAKIALLVAPRDKIFEDKVPPYFLIIDIRVAYPDPS